MITFIIGLVILIVGALFTLAVVIYALRLGKQKTSDGK